jgi:hypothetical protein
MYRGSLSIIVYDSFSEYAKNHLLQKLEGWGSINLLITDGIMLSPEFLRQLSGKHVNIQRVLTTHQIIRIMREQDMTACAMILKSTAVEEWDTESVNYMLDALAVWPQTRGLMALVEFIGVPPLKVRMNGVMKRAYYCGIQEVKEQWGETRIPQGRLWNLLHRQ